MYAAAGGGGGAWSGMAESVSDLKGAVHSGELFMDQDAANRLKKGMQNLQDTLRTVLRRGDIISQVPDIGDTPKTKVYKPFYASIATDQVQGLLPQVHKMHDDAQDIIDNIDACVRNMHETDSDGNHGFNGVMEV
jgi:hypothetical protein